MLKNVICYTTKKPVIYNKGTAYEKRCDHFLLKYFYGDDTQAQQEVDKLNKMLADGVAQYQGEDFTDIAKFYLSKQEEMH